MYKSLKTALKTILPRHFLFKNELAFRSVYYLFYKGKKHSCTVCSKSLKSFIRLDSNDTLCPSCGSLPRGRRLHQLLHTEFIKDGIHYLDFSPSRNLYRVFKANTKIHYVSTDYTDAFLADKQYDITNLDIADNTFNLITCYHILEHIEDDKKAMSELYRVLKPNGYCIIQTPFKDGDIYEDLSITTEAERLKHFGQEDHVRIYSVAGLQSRLEETGFKVDVRTYTEQPNNYYGFDEYETILVCTKA